MRYCWKKSQNNIYLQWLKKNTYTHSLWLIFRCSSNLNFTHSNFQHKMQDALLLVFSLQSADTLLLSCFKTDAYEPFCAAQGESDTTGVWGHDMQIVSDYNSWTTVGA